MSITAYILTSLIWAAGGFLLGFLLGRTATTVNAIRKKLDMTTGSEPDPELPGTPELRRRHQESENRTRRQRLFGAILVVLAVVSAVGIAVQTYRLNEVTECQAEWNDSYTSALRQRSDAAATERGAQRKLFTIWLSAPSRDEARAALKDYVDSLAQADTKREGAQIPTRKCNE